ncbi:hypothetical protein PRVXT_001579 [Proteinivorax tanatarense]|uniref:Uncharacterized protein n=1 Tax=Proteinivorax tanatarense TaxID=1260629 RepID=A0AAU7VI56_9FIRM
MKVEILQSLSGLDFSYKKGDKVNLDAKKAKSWIESGLAKEVKSESKSKGGTKKTKAKQSE